jgi:hypothetical protein
VRRTVFGRIAAFLTVLLALLAPLGSAGAQGTGRVTGTVTDSISGRELSDVQISVVGSRVGAVTDARGRYNLVGVPAGARVVEARRIGYQPAVVRGITVPAEARSR